MPNLNAWYADIKVSQVRVTTHASEVEWVNMSKFQALFYICAKNEQNWWKTDEVKEKSN